MPLIEIGSDKIIFERPLKREKHAKQKLMLSNPGNTRISFKVKTTAPKMYCVRPNSEFIEPHSYKEIEIMLQNPKEEPPLDEKCKDKFLVLCVEVNDALEKMDIGELWKHVEQRESGVVIDQKKLPCVYSQPSATTEVNDTSSNNTTAFSQVKEAAPGAVIAGTGTAAGAVPNTPVTNQSLKPDLDDREKLKKLEDEVNRYKEEIKSLKQAEPIVVEKVQVKTAGYSISMFILVSLLVAAVAYFVNSK